MVALDGSEHSERALDLASDIAAKYGAELVLLHVMSDKPLTNAERRMAEVEYPDEIAASLDATGIDLGGDPQIRAQRLLQHCGDVAHRCRQALGNRLFSQNRARPGKRRAFGTDRARGRRPGEHDPASG